MLLIIYTNSLKGTDVDVCERCFLCFGGMNTIINGIPFLLHQNLLIFYYMLGVDHFISCLLIMQQYKLLL